MSHNMEKEFHRQDMPFLGRDPTSEEIKEWKRREDEREYVFSGGKMMTGLDAQRAKSHMLNLHHSSCWLCAFPSSCYTAARDLEPYAKPHACVGCGIRMRYMVPFVAMGPSWYWGRPEDMTIPEILSVLEAHRAVWTASAKRHDAGPR
jgi:hypothetical protein